MKLNLRSRTVSSSGNGLTFHPVLPHSTTNANQKSQNVAALVLDKKSNPILIFSLTILFALFGFQTNAQVKLVQWSGLNVSNYMAEPTIVLGGLKAWDMRMGSGWYEASPSRQSINFTDNYMDKATTIRGQRNYWVLADKTDGAGSAYNDSNFVEYKVQAVGGAFNVSRVQLSAVFNGVRDDESGRMAVYYSIDNDAMSFANPMNLGTASLAMHDGTFTSTGTSIADPVHLLSAGTLSQTRIVSHAGDYSFTPGITLNDGQILTIRVYAWSVGGSSSINKALAIRNMVISNGTPWPSQQLSPTMTTMVKPTSVDLSSEVTTDGGYTVTQTGFAYTTDALFVRYTPGVNDKEGTVTGSSNTGTFTGTFTGLTPATTYWARSYANTENGTSYGKVVQFTTPDSVTAKPTVTTTAASNIMSATATSGGNISNNGGGQIVKSGLLYSKTLMDAASLIRGAVGSDSLIGTATSGSYVSDLTGLEAGTTYYIRAFAANSDSTGYGAVLSFTTTLVGITTTTPSNISATKATTGGTITPNGGGTITASGVVVSPLANPTLATPGAIITTENATTGTYVSNLTGLSANTTYNVKAYATIGGVTTYGDQKSFKTSVAPQLVQWSGLNVGNYMAEPTIVLGGLKAWDMRMGSGWYEASPARQTVNFTDNYMDKATTIRGQRNVWVLADKTDGAGAAYNDSNFVEYKVQAVGGAFNVGRVQLSAIFNGVRDDESGRMAVYYSIDNDAMSFANPMNLGTASLAMHDGTFTSTGTSIADPVHLLSAGTLSQTRIVSHAGDYSFTPGITLNDGQILTIRVYAWSVGGSSSINKALAIRNMVISNGTPWPSQQLSPTVASVVNPTSATMSSEVVTDGGYTVTQTGFAEVTDALFVREAPGVNDNDKLVTGSSTTGTFTGTFTGLKPATTYWARSYANTENGTSYGKIVQFVTPDSVTAKPTVTTTAVTNIMSATATSGGNISNNGGGQIVKSGLLYSKTLMDAASLIRGAVGSDSLIGTATSGSYVSDLTGLEAGTTYYIRAFAANSDSTGYGAVLSFTTTLVGITTTTPSNISATKATTGGTITPNGGGTITASGVVVSPLANPTLATPGAIITTENATTGTYVSNLTGLSANTTYNVKAYATIGGVTTYGDQKSFKTSVAPQLVQWSGLNVGNYMAEPTIVLGGLKAWDMRMGSGWYEASPARQTVNFTDNYMDKATTIRGQRNVWVLADKTDGAGAAYNDSNFVEYKVQAVGGAFNVGRVQLSAIFNGVRDDESGRMAVYYSIDNDAMSFANPMNLGTASLAMHDGTFTSTGTSIADPVHLLSAGTLSQTRIVSHAGDYSFTPGITLNDGQILTIRVYAWSVGGSSSINKALAIRNMVISNGTPWPSQQLSPTVASVVNPTSATMSSEVVTDGGYTVTQTGFAEVTDALFVREAPGVNDNDKLVTGSSTTGTFTGTFTGLKPATTYWARSYANTENGTSYGKIVQFVTPDSVTAKPTVTTTAVTNIMSSTATSGGNITNNGGGQIIASGILYSSTLMDPTTLIVGSGAAMTAENVPLGQFVSQMTGLAANTTYYVRAYASNSDSTGYGDILSFTTKLVDITTTPVSNVGATTATTGGTITPNNGGTITASGVIVSFIQNPTLVTPGAVVTTENVTSGNYVSSLSGLNPNTTYYVVAYATINGVTTYGQQVSFTTSSPLPVTLLSFTGKKSVDGAVLEWTTTREYNMSGYIVERSTSNTGFTAISDLIRPGLSSYSFTDRNIQNNVYYYRLRMVDNDGTFKYSNIVAINFDAFADITVSAYPNPASSVINVVHKAATKGSTVSILTGGGQIYLTKAMQEGDTQTVLDVSRLAAGVYYLTIAEKNKKSVIKFIKN